MSELIIVIMFGLISGIVIKIVEKEIGKNDNQGTS